MDRVTLDYETFYSKSFSLKKLRYSEYILSEPFYDHGVGLALNDNSPYWVSHDDIPAALGEFDWSRTALVGQNLAFDASILAWRYRVHPAFFLDTRLISTFLWPNESASLYAICERLWPNDETMRKGKELVQSLGIERLDAELEAIIAAYCMDDVRLTRAALYETEELVPEQELAIMDHTIRLFTRPLLRVDTEPLEEILNDVTTKTEALLQAAGVPREQLASNPQFAELLQDRGATVPTKTNAKGKTIPAFAKSDLGFQALMVDPEERVRALVAARLAVKSRITETRAAVLLDEGRYHRGRLPVPLKYAGARTRRFSSQQKVNFNNMPKKGKMRESIVAPPGFQLVTGDMSQIEVRLEAGLAKQPDLLEVFSTGGDPYKAFGAEIYNRPAEEVEGDDRFIAKGAVLGLGYGMGPPKFNMTLQSQAKTYLNKEIIIGLQEARRIVDAYRSKYWQIPRMWKTLDSFMGVLRSKNPTHKTSWYFLEFRPGRIVLPNGMDIQYTEQMLDKLWGGHLAENICQALGRILLVSHILEAEKRYRVVLHCYDELTCLVPDDEVEDAVPWLENLMCQPLDWCEDLPLAAEVVHGRHYSK